MIITRLAGGLGNQMFQYALGRSLAIKNDDTLKLDISHYANQSHIDTHRKYGLNAMKIDESIASELEIKKINYINASNLLIKKYFGKDKCFSYYSIVKEKNQYFDNEVLSKRGNIYLEGYWQSYKYFNGIKKFIYHDFQSKNAVNYSNPEISKWLKEKNFAVIHVRRGDYVTNNLAKDVLGALPANYYLKAATYIKKLRAIKRYVIVSDEIDWCRQSLSQVEKLGEVMYYAGNEIEDLNLMEHSAGNVLSNSTFSWWGSYLNRNASKIIISPKKWYKNSIYSDSDLIPPEWIRL